MPDMVFTPRTMNDKSALTEGWHPAFLMEIRDELTPDGWKMAEQSPRMWRWLFLCWETPALIAHHAPERQSAPTSQKFSPGGKFQPSKAYVWACELLGHKIEPGEHVNLDAAMPLPCRVKIRRNNDYANIIDLERWADGAQVLTPEFQGTLLDFYANPPTPEPAPPAAKPATASKPAW